MATQGEGRMAQRARSHGQHGRLWWWLLATLVAGVGAAGVFFSAGEFLVAEDHFSHADVALVLSGLPISRAFAASDLYRQGRVEQVWAIPEPPNKIEGEGVTDQVKDELIALKLFDPSLPQWSERILVATGVPREHIVMLPTFANGTIGEARLVATFLRGRSPHSLALITSKSASRRARFIFRRVLKKTRVQIFSAPTPYDSFESTRWWSRPRNALTVVTEYQKFLANALTLTFGLDRR